MADEKLTFLMEVELPPFCFLSEAIDWIAFGRVPQMQPVLSEDNDEFIDIRFDWREMPDSFEPQFEYPWFDRLEFQSLGIPITEEYFTAAERCNGADVWGLKDAILHLEAKLREAQSADSPYEPEHISSLLEEERARLAELGSGLITRI